VELLKNKKDKRQAKTALDLSPLEWRRYHPFETDERRISPHLTHWQASTRKVAESIAQELVKHFGARRVVLFGSAARGGIHERSDIDLAVWGIPPRIFIGLLHFPLVTARSGR